jgi:hypothetical protein
MEESEMTWSECVIDATMGARAGLFTFCPIEGDINGEYQIVTGMNFLGAPPADMKVVAVVHEDGQTAVDEFCEQHKDALQRLAHDLEQRKSAPAPPEVKQ